MLRVAGCALAAGMLARCMPGEISARAAQGEPAAGAALTLTVNGDNYEIDRNYREQSWHGEPLVVPRASVAPECERAQFFLDDRDHEIRVAEAVTPPPVKAAQLPVPGADFPPCALLVSYGAFAGPPPLEGLFVTGPAGLVAQAPREPSQPGYYALVPFEAVGEVWLFAGAVLATPVLLPGGAAYGHHVTEKQKKERARAEAALPPEVAACWKAAEKAASEASVANPTRRFTAFTWPATRAGSHVLRPGASTFAADPPVAVDAEVTLRFGRLALNEPVPYLWTDAEFDCGLAAGAVVASRIRLRE